MSNVVNFSTSSWKEYNHLSSSFDSVLKPWLEVNVPEFLTLFSWSYTNKTVYFRSNANRWENKVSIDGYNPAKAIVFKRGADIVLDDILLKKFQVAVGNDIKLSELVKSKSDWRGIVRGSVKNLKDMLAERRVDVNVEFDYYSDFQSIAVSYGCAAVTMYRDMHRNGYKPSIKTRSRIDSGSTLVEVERKLELFRADAAVLAENLPFIMDNICPEFWNN